MKHHEGFLSYAHADLALVRELVGLISPRLRIGRKHAATLWNDQEIVAGARWRHAIDEAMDRSALAILAVSPAFLDSDFIRDVELPVLLAAPGKVVVPVLLNDVDFRHHRMHGIEHLQVFAYLAPTWTQRRSFRATPRNRRDDFVNRLVEEITICLESTPLGASL